MLLPGQSAAVARVSEAFGGFARLRAPRPHRQRQDRGLPAGRGAGHRRRTARPGAGAGDRADAAARRALQRALRRADGGAAFGTDRRASGWLPGGTPPAVHARIVLGTRSAVFAPMPQPGVIIVDEEHDGSFKQHEGALHYSARDLALVRGAARAACPWCWARPRRRSRRCRTSTPAATHGCASPRRAAQDRSRRRWSSWTCAPRRCAPACRRRPSQAIERHLAADGQVMVFLNRRGYAPTLLCTACGWVAPCSECDARLTVHRPPAGCAAITAARTRRYLRAVRSAASRSVRGPGNRAHPGGARRAVPAGVTLVRARSRRGAASRRHGGGHARHRRGEARILVGTQMVTKGHDFPNMTLVVVMNADQGLFSTDFRARRATRADHRAGGRARRPRQRGRARC